MSDDLPITLDYARPQPPLWRVALDSFCQRRGRIVLGLMFTIAALGLVGLLLYDPMADAGVRYSTKGLPFSNAAGASSLDKRLFFFQLIDKENGYIHATVVVQGDITAFDMGDFHDWRINNMTVNTHPLWAETGAVFVLRPNGALVKTNLLPPEYDQAMVTYAAHADFVTPRWRQEISPLLLPITNTPIQ